MILKCKSQPNEAEAALGKTMVHRRKGPEHRGLRTKSPGQVCLGPPEDRASFPKTHPAAGRRGQMCTSEAASDE